MKHLFLFLFTLLSSCNFAFGQKWHQDSDNDGYGNPNVTKNGLFKPQGYVKDGADCNDQNAAIHPNAVELCNGIDDNCNGLIDDGTMMHTYYADADGDGYGNALSSITTCAVVAPAGYTSDNTDCNDNDATIHSPIAYYPDNDGDNFGSGTGVLFCLNVAPKGFSSNNTDPDDTRSDLTPNTIYDPTRIVLMVSDTVPLTIPKVFGCSFNNLSQSAQVSTNPTLLAYIKAINPSYIGWVNGSSNIPYQILDSRGTYGVGYNCYNVPGMSFNECSGINFPVWPDYLYTLQQTGALPMLTLNVWQYQTYPANGHAAFWNMLARMKTDLDGIGISTSTAKIVIQLGIEMHTAKIGVSGTVNMDQTTYSGDITAIVAGAKAMFPNAIFTADTWGQLSWDNAAMAKSVGTSGNRIYYQHEVGVNDDWSSLAAYAALAPSAIRQQLVEFPGKFVSVAQTETKDNDITFATCEQMEYEAMMFGNFLREATLDGNMISYIGQFNLKKLFDSKNHMAPEPQYYASLYLSNLCGDTYESSTVLNSSGIWSLAGKDVNGNVTVVLVNKNPYSITLDQIAVNRAQKPFTITCYSGIDLSATVTITTGGLALPAHSFDVAFIPK